MKMADAISTAIHASRTLSAPRGISRICVRGFRASYSRSTMRLKPIAANRAAVNASIVQPSIAPGDRV